MLVGLLSFVGVIWVFRPATTWSVERTFLTFDVNKAGVSAIWAKSLIFRMASSRFVKLSRFASSGAKSGTPEDSNATTRIALKRSFTPRIGSTPKPVKGYVEWLKH